MDNNSSLPARVELAKRAWTAPKLDKVDMTAGTAGPTRVGDDGFAGRGNS